MIVTYQTPLPPVYHDLVTEKSNLLIRANMLEAQREFESAAELFAKVAKMEARLAKMAQKYNLELGLVHLVGKMSSWAAAGDTYRAGSRGQQILALSGLTPAQYAHVNGFVMQLRQRRQQWMQSWGQQEYAIA